MDHEGDIAFAQPLLIMAARNRPEKHGYIIAKDLKAAGPLVPQLQEAGYVKWPADFADASDVMQRQDSLLDLERDQYTFEEETSGEDINRMVVWLLLTRSTKGYEDLIEEEVQSGDKNFLAAYKNIHFVEFNRVTTMNPTSMHCALTSTKPQWMARSLTCVRLLHPS